MSPHISRPKIQRQRNHLQPPRPLRFNNRMRSDIFRDLLFPPQEPLPDLIVVGVAGEPQMQCLMPFREEFCDEEVCCDFRVGGEEGGCPGQDLG